MKTTAYKFNLTGLLMVVFLLIAGYGQSQNNCVPDSLTATHVTAHSANLAWVGIHGPTHVRYYVTGTTDYVIKNAHMNHINLHNLTPETAYSWDLSNFCNGAWTEYTGDGSFTTLADTIPPPPPPTCIPDSLTATHVTAHSANLAWKGIHGPTHVRYYMTGTTDYVIKETHSNHICLHNLTPETAYSWDLSNFCNGAWTEYTGDGSFTTLADTIPPPPPPTCIPDSLTATHVTAHSANLGWKGIHGPTHVRYYMTGTTDYVIKETHSNHICLHNLTPETPYSWDLSNFCNGAWTEYTGNGSFTTLADTIPPPPPPTCIPDSLTATHVTAHSANLGWKGIHGPTHVRYYMTGTTDYVIKNAHMNHINLHNLTPETAYSWDLSNFCNGAWTEYTGDGSFTTLADTIPPPPPPTCIPDSLTATHVGAHSANLAWKGIHGPTHVRYYVTGTTDYVIKNTHSNHIMLHNLTPETPYSWDLSNFCNGAWTEYTGDGSFTTLADTIPPPPPPTCVPDSLTASNITATTADLHWEGIHGPTHVRYYVTGTTDYAMKETHSNHIFLDSLTPDTPYSWDLSNLCHGTWTEYTGDGSFTTSSEMYITGINNVDGQTFSNISVRPNPIKEKATVTFTSVGSGSFVYKIIDITGRELIFATDQASSGVTTFELNLAGNPKGIYFLHLQKGSEIKHVKIIKE